jgi:pimeloyl-ACP methyl ester carboxylesterase
MDGAQGSETTVDTQVGPLHVQQIGTGLPDAVLWHSLFVDSRTWQRVVDDLARDRRLTLITGPGHGRSGNPSSHYTMEDCAAAATTVMDTLDLEQPVDWVGNAWGGHVGITLAARQPRRFRTLVTVCTPVHSYTMKGRLETTLLLLIYRLFGPVPFVRDAVVEALLSERTRAEDPEALALVRDSFTGSDRRGLTNAVVSISLRRPDLHPLLPLIATPTLLITGSEHRDWSPEQATRASQALPQGSSAVLEGAAYLGPLETPRELVRLVRDFWASHPPGPPTTVR